jgi:hypothetical protein
VPEGMLLVGDSITRKLVSAGPETTAVEAVAPRRTNGIRHVPSLGGGWFVSTHASGSRSNGAKRGAGTGADGVSGGA